MTRSAEIPIPAFVYVLSMPLRLNHKRHIRIFFLTDVSAADYVMFHVPRML